MLQLSSLAALALASNTPTPPVALLTPASSSIAQELDQDVWWPTFAPGTSTDYMHRVFEQLPPIPEYVLGPRWNGVQGAPASVTWSFVPDNVVIPSLIGENGQLNGLFARMDALFSSQGGRAAWIARIQNTFDRWEELSGIDFTRITVGGTDWDDGATWGSFGNATRGDIRIAMKRLDSVDGVLAIGAFPGNGDIVLDRFENWGLATDANRYLRNNFAKNVGHAIGLDLVCPNDNTKLMEPIVSAGIDGPQQDDVRGVQRHYGDPFEPDDTALAATNLGTPTISVPISVGALPPPLVGSADPNAALLSIDADGENDWWKFSINAPQFFDITVTPIGSVYASGTQDGGGACTVASPNFDALAHADLAVQVIAPNGTTVIANASGNPAGFAESLIDVGLNTAGTYYLRVYETNAPTQTQGYAVTLLVKPCGIDSDGDGTPDCADGCPNDPNKLVPGACGCGVFDTDTDGDGTADCNDGCPSDPLKIAPGQCGCGNSDLDSDGDGVANCLDNCPNDPNKLFPGVCGCGVPDVDSDGDGVLDCNDGCPNDPQKIAPGICGCGFSDIDSDGDGVADCLDGCPNDPLKIAPGLCGCGVPDTDSDGDGVVNCLDGCPNDPLKTSPGACGCGVADVDTDGDGTLDCFDLCPSDPLKIVPGICGCGVSDADSDGDGVANCNDGCPNDPLKIAPGTCGCGQPDNDVDGDGIAECVDNCPALFNPNQADNDNDHVGNVCDNCVFNFNPAQEDCDLDGDGDVCEIANGSEEDCDQNGIPDNCEPDCNHNGRVDGCDILLGSSLDQNANRVPDECEAPCPAIQTYCTGKPNSLGCVPHIGSSGIPSLSTPTGFVISCTNVIPDRNGLLFYGFAASYAPFQGGYLCIKPPFVRTPIQLSTGTTPCNGLYQMDFNAWIATGIDPLLVPATNVFARWWMRDPQASFTTGFSNAITFTICN